MNVMWPLQQTVAIVVFVINKNTIPMKAIAPKRRTRIIDLYGISHIIYVHQVYLLFLDTIGSNQFDQMK